MKFLKKKKKQAIQSSGLKYYRDLSKQNGTFGIWFTVPLSQGSANFFCKGQIVNILCFVVHLVGHDLLTPALGSN